MPLIRAFIAIEIENRAKQKISNLISNLKESNADAKWITDDQMHITLKFLGNIEKNVIPEISYAMSSISNNFYSFAINFSKISAFPSLNRPDVIWLGIDKGAESLKMLNKKIEDIFWKLGFKQEDREFKPHLTLARIRSLKNILNLAKLIKETDFNLWDDLQVNRLALFQSALNPKSAVHTIVLEKYLQNI